MSLLEIPLPEKDLRELPLSSLAYIGDAIYELFIREKIFSTLQTKSRPLHYQAVTYVKASTQAELAKYLYYHDDFLTEEEKVYLLRGRNSKTATKAKNADAVDYHWATALEVLVAYVYYADKAKTKNRCIALLNHCWTYMQSKKIVETKKYKAKDKR